MKEDGLMLGKGKWLAVTAQQLDTPEGLQAIRNSETVTENKRTLTRTLA